jgi:hypothetical protein
MSDMIEHDLVNAHGDALVARDEREYRHRYNTLFGVELTMLEPLFELGEYLHRFFHEPVVIRSEFRSNLKADLMAEWHQQRANERTRAWRWAAYGAASVAVAGVIAAASWRAVQARYR